MPVEDSINETGSAKLQLAEAQKEWLETQSF
jgi:hypothetical protein